MKYKFIKIEDSTDAQGRILPKGVYYIASENKYNICVYHNGKTYIFTSSRNYDDAMNKYNNIMNTIDRYGFDYAYDHKKDFQTEKQYSKRYNSEGKELPQGVSFDNLHNYYVLSFSKNNKTYRLSTFNTYEEMMENYDKIIQMIKEYGLEYTYEHRKDFQKKPRKEETFIREDKNNRWRFDITINGKYFSYSNKDLDKVREVRDYFLKNGEKATIEKYNLYRNDDKETNYVQTAMNLYEGKTIRSNNISGVNGVYWNAGRKRWIGQITINGKVYCLGYFKNKADAVKARELANEKGIEWYKEHKKEYFNKNEIEFEEDTTTWDSLDNTFDRKLNAEIKGNIYITGMQGSGKTTLAHDLKKEYGYKITHLDDFIDKYNEDEVDEIIEEFVEKSNNTTGNIIEGVQLLDLLDLIDLDKHTVILINNDPKEMQQQMWERDKIKPETIINGVEVFTPGEHYEQYMKMYNSKKPILEELRKDKRIIKIKNVESL